MNNLAKDLQAPFRTDEYEWRAQMASHAGDKVQVLCYVTARAIMNRLDEVFDPMGWGCSYESGASGGVLCNLWAWTDSGRRVCKADGADNTDIEAVKGGISSALKRAANVWGIGRLLYKLEANWVSLSKERGRGSHYFKYPQKHKMAGQIAFWAAPLLPGWAVSDFDAKSAYKPAQPEELPENVSRMGEALGKMVGKPKPAPELAFVKKALLDIVTAAHKCDAATARGKIVAFNKGGQPLQTIMEVLDLAGSMGFRIELASKCGLAEDGEVVPDAS